MRGETDAVVLNLQQVVLPGRAQRDPQSGGATVFDGVDDRLPGDGMQLGHLEFAVAGGFRNQAEFYFHVIEHVDLPREGAEGGGESLAQRGLGHQSVGAASDPFHGGGELMIQVVEQGGETGG